MTYKQTAFWDKYFGRSIFYWMSSLTTQDFFSRINADQIQDKETLCKKYLQTSIWIKPQSALDGIWFTSSFIL